MSEDKRLRVHPDQRFDHSELQFDLNDVAAKLQAEPLGNRRHRQETIYRHGPLTVALFLFETGASMAEHEAKGTVTVQVLKGRLKMSADGQVHDLPAGSLLVLAPGVRHDVQAIEASQMLLTVCLDQREPTKDSSIKTKTTIDVRTIPGPQRHPMIFSTFDSLQPGEALEIVNDHDPVPLHNQFNLMKRGQFDWQYLQRGPDLFRVRIARVESH